MQMESQIGFPGPLKGDRGGRSLLDRAVAVVAPVAPGEGLTAVMLAGALFLLLTSYYLVKPVREALVLQSPGGAELKAYAAGGAAVLLLWVVPAYGALSARLPRNRLVGVVTALFALCLLGFYVLGQQEGLRGALGVPFYLWASIFGLMAVAQSWSFANDVMSIEQGQRLFAVVGLGASLGAVAGSKLTAWLLEPPTWAPWPSLSVFALMPLSALLLLASALLTEAVHRRTLPPRSTAPDAPAAQRPPLAPDAGAFRLVLGQRYLRLLACGALLFTCVNSNSEYLLGKLVAAESHALPALERGGFIASFYADFYFWVNSVALLLQALGVSRIVRGAGIRTAFLLLPALVLIGSGLMVMLPVLSVLCVVKVLENAGDYSLANTVRHMLWLPTSIDVKYKAKMAIDTLMVRLGDVSTSLCVLGASAGLAGLGHEALSVRGFATLNLALAVGGLALAAAIAREHGRVGAAT